MINQMRRKPGLWSQIGGERGQSLVELALALPLLLTIFSLVFDLGRAVQTYTVMVNASREAVMAGARNQLSNSTLEDLVRAELARSNVDGDSAAITIGSGSAGNSAERTVVVSVDIDFSMVTFFLAGTNIPLSVTTTMVTFW